MKPASIKDSAPDAGRPLFTIKSPVKEHKANSLVLWKMSIKIAITPSPIERIILFVKVLKRNPAPEPSSMMVRPTATTARMSISKVKTLIF